MIESYKLIVQKVLKFFQLSFLNANSFDQYEAEVACLLIKALIGCKFAYVSNPEALNAAQLKSTQEACSACIIIVMKESNESNEERKSKK